MRTINRTLILLGLAALVALLTLTAACGGSGDNGDSGDSSTTTDTDTGTGDDAGEQPTPRPTNTPAPAGVGGAPLPEEWDGSEGIAATESSADMVAIGADGYSGTLHLIQIERKTKVTVTLDGAAGPYSAAVRRGGCPEEGAEASGQFDYLLFDIVDGESVSMVNTPAQFFQFSLAYVAVVAGTDLENDPLISCGNIPSPLR